MTKFLPKTLLPPGVLTLCLTGAALAAQDQAPAISPVATDPAATPVSEPLAGSEMTSGGEPTSLIGREVRNQQGVRNYGIVSLLLYMSGIYQKPQAATTGLLSNTIYLLQSNCF